MVGNGSAAGAESATDEGTFASTEESAYDCSTHCGAADDLGAGVVLVIVRAL